jgi:hypothetical protein
MVVRVTSSDSEAVSPLERIVELAARADADRWAQDCGWVPGTGHCRNRRCSARCVFRAQQAAGVEQVTRTRRLRRPAQRPGAERPTPAPAALYVLRRLLRGAFG